ncbi:MAG: P-loop NTPase [Alphaproteobacteria bacterium]|nr:P-loop NTPase [Alphaproteobacteria bacterium]
MSTEAAINISQLPVLGRNVMTIASGKGGVGKTWFAITLAHALAKSGRKTLLFDGDLGLANVDIQLGLMPDRDLASVIVGKLTLEQSIIDVPEIGFSVIAGRSGSGSLALLPPPRLNALREQLLRLAALYDSVIIDLGAGVDRTVQSLPPPRGACFVVTTDEPTALTDAYAFIKVTIADRPNADIRVVVNLAESQSAGEKTYETLVRACRSFLKFEPPLAGIIRRDGKVRQCIQQQKPLLTLYPNCDAAADVERLARNLPRPP